MAPTTDKQRFLIHITLLSLALLLLARASFSTLTFFASDTGLRFLQIRQLITHHWHTFAIDYPARFLDPELQYTPYYYAYSLLDDQIYLNISHLLPWAASFLYALLGPIGLSILPVAGGLLTAVATYKLGILAQVKQPYLLLWATMFATPILFYSLELWDHTLAAACAVWAVYGVAAGIINGRWQPMFWGGIAVGIGLGQRPEMYVFIIALGIALIISAWPQWRKWLTFIGGGLTGALPVWILQYHWVGHPLGLALAPHLFRYGRPETYPVQSYSGLPIPAAAKIGHLLLHTQPQTITALFSLIIGIFMLVFSLRLPALRRPFWLWGGLLFTLLSYGLYIMHAEKNLLVGLITTFPLITFAVAHADNPHDKSTTYPVYRLTSSTALIFLGLMLAFWPAFGGEQWGARYLLPAYPLLLFSAFYVYTEQVGEAGRPYINWLHAAFITLLGASFILQAMGARLLLIKHTEQLAIKNAVTNLPAELILTNSPFFPSSMSAVDGKLFMYINSQEDWETLIPRLTQNNIYRFALVPLADVPINRPQQVKNIHFNQLSDFIYELEINDP